MDNRASAITEAAADGASDDDIASSGTHENKRTTREIYMHRARQISERVQAVSTEVVEIVRSTARCVHSADAVLLHAADCVAKKTIQLMSLLDVG